MNYSTVIFDLDGTLLDTSEGIMSGAANISQKMGGPLLTKNQQLGFIGPPIIQSFMKHCGFSEEVAKEAVELYRNRYIHQGIYEAKIYSQIGELLKLLKAENCSTGVATLKRDDLAKRILKEFGLSQYFDSINGIDMNDSFSKTEIISHCLEEIGQSDLTKIVMIGDSIYDAIGAEQAGIDFIAVTYGFGFKSKIEASQCKNVFIADSVNELIKYFVS